MYRIKKFFELNVRQLGLFTGLFFSFVLLPVFYFLDVNYLSQFHLIDAAHFETLKSFNYSLSGILISILLTTFSVVFVVMQLASSQFSPRILRYFMANDLKIQQFIGLYLGAIASIFILQIIDPFFPYKSQACLVFSLGMSLYCILILFPKVIIHLNDNMNVATVTSKIKNDVVKEIENLYNKPWQCGDRLMYKRKKKDDNVAFLKIVWEGESGYLTEVNYSKLIMQIEKFRASNISFSGVKIYQKPIVGEFIMSKASVLFLASFDKGISIENRKKMEEQLTEIAQEVFHIHKYRNYKQDITFGVRKLVDIAIKAISPAVNDPTTCLNCIDYLGEIVLQLSTRRFPSDETVRLQNKQIFVNEFDFSEFVNFAFDQIFQWGKKDTVVVKRLLQTMYQIVPHVHNPYHLMVLIKEIKEMQLERIFVSNINEFEHTNEQIRIIHKQLTKFETVAKNQIENLQSMGYLDCYLTLEQDEISVLEQESVLYLKHFSG